MLSSAPVTLPVQFWLSRCSSTADEATYANSSATFVLSSSWTTLDFWHFSSKGPFTLLQKESSWCFCLQPCSRRVCLHVSDRLRSWIHAHVSRLSFTSERAQRRVAKKNHWKQARFQSESYRYWFMQKWLPNQSECVFFCHAPKIYPLSHFEELAVPPNAGADISVTATSFHLWCDKRPWRSYRLLGSAPSCCLILSPDFSGVFYCCILFE